jgi:exonuclease 3'-5' domain-containing protein 1
MLCLQVTDVAYRRSVRRLPVKFVVGLKKIMEQHLSLAGPLMETKEKGVALFAPERGGSYEVWNARPLDPLLVEYAASDVLYFPQLVAKLWGPLNPKARGWVLTESEKRCNVGSDPAYQPNGREKSIAPVFPF